MSVHRFKDSLKPNGLPSRAIFTQFADDQTARREIINKGPNRARSTSAGKNNTKAIIRLLKGLLEAEVEADAAWKVSLIITLISILGFGGIAGLLLLADHLNLFTLLAKLAQ